MTLVKYINCQSALSESTTRGCANLLRRYTQKFLLNCRRVPIRGLARMADACNILVLCGPSGSGKSSLLQRLLEKYPNSFGFSASHTTRKPRAGEIDGVHYNFTDKENMQAAIDNGEFIESAVYSGNMYGTSKSAVSKVLDCGKVCILDIDCRGVRQVKRTPLKTLMIFVKPPSIDELEKRLRARQTETEESLEQRLKTAIEEMEYGLAPENFHKIITNDELDRAYEEFENYIFENLNINTPMTK